MKTEMSDAPTIDPEIETSPDMNAELNAELNAEPNSVVKTVTNLATNLATNAVTNTTTRAATKRATRTMECGYTHLDTPLGTMLLVASAEGLCGAYFVDQKYVPAIAAHWRERDDDALLNAAAAQLRAYFAGALKRFDVPLAAVGTAFQQSVWNAIASVGYGERISYGELARRAGRAGSVRAAGTATGRNPISIIVPCHRIVGADGSLTGYAGGLPRKQRMLALELGMELGMGMASGTASLTGTEIETSAQPFELRG